tara:strand:- start:9 stop:299 length:291 start_codon:yes stop_codon:yes gene_type:complete
MERVVFPLLMEHQVQRLVVGLVAVVVKDTGLVDHNLPVLVALVVAAMEQRVLVLLVLQTPVVVAVVEIMVVVLDMVAVVLVEYSRDHINSLQDRMQ